MQTTPSGLGVEDAKTGRRFRRTTGELAEVPTKHEVLFSELVNKVVDKGHRGRRSSILQYLYDACDRIKNGMRQVG